MNVFLVTSPLQYICALEAKQYFNCKNNILLLVKQTSKQGILQQDKLLDHNDWQHVIILERNSRSIVVPKGIKKVKAILNGTPIEHFFYAEYNAWRTKLLIRNLDIKKEIYFDDGTLTLLEYEHYIKPQKSFHRPRFIHDLIVRFNGAKPVGLLPKSDSLEIFSLFNIESETITCHKNQLTRLKEFYGHPQLFNPTTPIGFIGQGGIGDKYKKSVDEYVTELFNLSNKLNKKILYFPHRTENEKVKALLIASDHIIYHQSELPLEIELIDKGIQLSALICSFSTVLFTCRLLSSKIPLYSLFDTHPDKKFERVIRKEMTRIGVVDLHAYDELTVSELRSL